MRRRVPQTVKSGRDGNRQTWFAVIAIAAAVIAGCAILLASLSGRRGRADTKSSPQAVVARSLPQTRRLMVSLDYRPTEHVGTTVLSFPRNRVAVVRAGDHLALETGVAAHRRPMRTSLLHDFSLRVTLDLDADQITANAGEETVRVTRRLAPETRVLLDRGTARTGHVRISGLAASAGAGDRATPGLFAPESVWRAPLADDAPLDSASARLVGGLRSAVAANLAARTGPWIATNESSTPLYRVPADQPRVRVQLHTGPWGATLQKAFEAVPVPPDARPARGTDAHMTVWQPSTDRLWEFFRMRKESDGWHADYGGAIENVSRSPGYYTTDSWPGLSNSQWGASASSLPLVAGLMRTDELRAGHIDHAVSLAIPVARRNVFSWPAQRTDGRSDDANAIPEGAHFRLDPTLDLSTLNLPRMTRIMAEAAQRYGMIVTDQTGQAVGFAAEDPTPTGNDPYYGTNGLFDGHWPSELLAQFPWEHLQLLRMDLHTT
jgi:hypothetical protein